MVYEFPDLTAYSPDQLDAVHPDLGQLRGIMRRNLRLLDTILDTDDHDPGRSVEPDTLRAELYEADVRIETLEHDISTARAWIEHLQAKLSAAEDHGDDAYRVVGLSEVAHTVVVAAARRALLRHHHPDHADEANKASATAQFARISAAFDRIAELRG